MTVTNKQIAHVFGASLNHIKLVRDPWADGVKFICWAIEDSFAGTQAARDAAKRVIGQRIYPYISMDDWLQQQFGVRKFNRVYTFERMQQHRVAWLKQLIEEFETKKD